MLSPPFDLILQYIDKLSSPVYIMWTLLLAGVVQDSVTLPMGRHCDLEGVHVRCYVTQAIAHHVVWARLFVDWY